VDDVAALQAAADRLSPSNIHLAIKYSRREGARCCGGVGAGGFGASSSPDEVCSKRSSNLSGRQWGLRIFPLRLRSEGRAAATDPSSTA
jgi:hypothetical protein